MAKLLKLDSASTNKITETAIGYLKSDIKPYAPIAVKNDLMKACKEFSVKATIKVDGLAKADKGDMNITITYAPAKRNDVHMAIDNCGLFSKVEWDNSANNANKRSNINSIDQI